MEQSGRLYIVATPIGNLKDFTFRAVEVLQTVDYIYAEDTRHSRKLCQHFNIHKPIISLHQFNEAQRIEKIISALQAQKSIALISDAGTPLIHDPGSLLVSTAHRLGIRVHPIPGSCALIAALSASGLPGNRFIFEGFLAHQSTKRRKQLMNLKDETRTLILYEAPHRIKALLDDLETILGSNRQIVIARELTKKFETIQSGTIETLKPLLLDAQHTKGEFVVLIGGAQREVSRELSPEVERLLRILTEALPLSQATQLASKITGLHKNKLYPLALGQNHE
jgi:16S rRNA (cytidine1402-2'-O)-methyltransferase